MSYEVIAESNGHHWIERYGFVLCRDCGFLRRIDDDNKLCRGVVGVVPREHSELLELIRELACDLEALVRARYPAELVKRYPSVAADYDRDMAVVNRARELLRE